MAQKWYAGSDHAGYRMKVALIQVLTELGDEIIDLGCDDAETSVDYPDFGQKVALAVAKEAGTFGLLVCGSGIGISIAGNKVDGVRAARVGESYSARMARMHNDANIICMGERVTGLDVAKDCLLSFRDAQFEGGRHQRRVDKLVNPAAT